MSKFVMQPTTFAPKFLFSSFFAHSPLTLQYFLRESATRRLMKSTTCLLHISIVNEEAHHRRGRIICASGRAVAVVRERGVAACAAYSHCGALSAVPQLSIAERLADTVVCAKLASAVILIIHIHATCSCAFGSQ